MNIDLESVERSLNIFPIAAKTSFLISRNIKLDSFICSQESSLYFFRTRSENLTGHATESRIKISRICIKSMLKRSLSSSIASCGASVFPTKCVFIERATTQRKMFVRSNGIYAILWLYRKGPRDVAWRIKRQVPRLWCNYNGSIEINFNTAREETIV